MKKIFFIGVLLFASFTSWARHIKGGEIYYEYLGPGSAPNTNKYLLTLRLFISCQSSQGQLEESVNLGVFKLSNNDNVQGSPFTLPLTDSRIIQLTKPSPCIINPSPVCYWIRIFSITIELPKDPKGYGVVFQRCCRIDDISNLSGKTNIGASYTCEIDGTDAIGINGTNSDPQFLVKDTALICQNRPFTLTFTATDVENDSLSYSFAPAYVGGGLDDPIVTNPSPPADLQALGYASGFSGEQPLGPGVTIDPKTGVISGIAPTGGDYVVCVLLKEWRNGKVISRKWKDFIVHIDDRCDFAAADLKPSYITCDGLSYTFKNEAPPSSLIHTYFWDFGIDTSSTDTSTLATPLFTFPDTGTYHVKLIVNKGEECSDSAFTLMKVYPGFFPGFVVTGSCLYVPFTFKDTTKTRYGAVSNWYWVFGDESTQADTSTIQNPGWQYATIGSKPVQFIVGNTKGCLDTVTQNISVLDKPIITMPFRDTLICSIDTLQLHASGLGNFTWTPTVNLLSANTDDPLVYPKTTTVYYVQLVDAGCVNTDSIRVRVVDFVTLTAGPDTTICLTDTINLRPTGDGLKFLWSPAATLDDPTLKNPAATPTGVTTYHVVASIGKCNASSDVTINTVPYPGSFAGNDTTICYDDTAQLNASIRGRTFAWTPTSELSNPSILNPLAFPLQTTSYSLFVYDILGCPKPGVSTVKVTVEPPVIAFAGNDTSVVVGQPLHLLGTGAPLFEWNPPQGLESNTVQDPVAILYENTTYQLKAYTPEGCFGLDTIKIRVFKTAPDIFVPNAFTPGGNSNTIFKPITPGISSLEYFRVYNRWGQLIYSTTRIGAGWDGSFNGKPQDNGTFVWMVKGTDYTGKTIAKKGTVVLIR